MYVLILIPMTKCIFKQFNKQKALNRKANDRLDAFKLHYFVN